ncbi:C-type lectin domain family 2 member D [Varanus komodoensis]|nr:C-type lectin domain family 2 member D [Varanus komodoensis]
MSQLSQWTATPVTPTTAISCSAIRILHIPTAILVVLVFASILCIARFSGSAVKDKQMSCVKNACIPLVPPCTPGWIGYEGKCYFFSEDERNWTASQAFCASCGSSLASIESEPEKARPAKVQEVLLCGNYFPQSQNEVFLLRYKGNADHWIGLWKDQSQIWKWADGAAFRNTVHIGGEGGNCAFLSMDIAITSRCYIPRNWICSHLDAYRKNRSSAEGP